MIGYFNDDNCHGKHIGAEIPMTTNCTKFQPNRAYERLKFSWHHGPGKVEFFLNENCVKDVGYNGLLVKSESKKHPEWDCVNLFDWQEVSSMMVPH